MHKPLTGIKVLDLTNVLAGPFCCHQLAHMGAEVIKVEAVGRGDLARQLGADAELNAANMGVSFLAQNAGKKSVTLNLKHPEGKQIFLRLLAQADVLVENFRPGVMARLGLDYPELKQHNPRLIYCAISGFGQQGPWSQRPAYDQIIQATAGVMSITGSNESGPMRVGYPIADTVGGITAAFAISSALNAQPRGCFIDVAMLDALLATMGWVISNYLIASVAAQSHGNENPTSAPSGAFATAAGLLNIAANKDEQWLLLCQHLGLDELPQHPDYLTREDRKRNRVALRQRLEQVLLGKSARVWEQELNSIGVPAAAVLSVAEVLSSEQISQRDLLADFAQAPGVGRDIRLLRTGVKIDGAALSVKQSPPELGQDNEEIYQQLGLSLEQIQQLRTQGVL